ncbi:MAG TPA: PAS domain-containing protein, partial [Gemmatimonadaceae bacterium]
DTDYRNLAAIGDARAQQIRQWRRDELAAVATLAHTPGFASGVAAMSGTTGAPAADARVPEYLRLGLTPSRRIDALVLSLDERVIASAGADSAPLAAPASRRAAATALATGNATLSSVFLNAHGVACIDAAAPIRTAAGRTVGVLLLRSDARASLTPRPQNSRGASGDIDTYVVERMGDSVSVLTDRRVPPDTTTPLVQVPLTRSHVAVVKAALGNVGVYESRSASTGEIVADMRPVPDSPWFLVTWEHAEAQTAAIRRQTVLVVGVVAVLILLAGAAVAHEYRLRQAAAYRALYESERQRREGEERLRAIVDAEPECVKVVDRGGRVLEMNAAGLAMLEANALEDVQRQPLETYILPPYRQAFRALHAGVMRGQAGVLEFEIVGLKGSHRWLETHAVPLRDKQGEIDALLGVTRDVTERRRSTAELALQSSALNAAADAIVITDRDGTIQWVNSAFVALTGYTAEEAVGRNPRALVKSGVHDEAFFRKMWQTILAGNPWRGELTNRRKDGSHYLEEQTITPVRTAGDAITHFVAVKRDITAQRELETQFLQAQKMETVGRLAGGVAHDFNNLLTVINGTAEMLLKNPGASDGNTAELQAIADAGNRAAQLTRQLLAFSRKQMLQVEPLHLNTSLRGMEGMLRRMLGEDMQLVLDLADDLDLVRADPGQLDQVILNLVVNARDAMPRGGTLTIQTRNMAPAAGRAASHAPGEAGRHVLLAIRDTGLGMDDVTRERIFEPFFTTKELGRGTGLGLSTVYGIVKQSGGSISVDSEPGRGTTFSILLPSVDASTLRSTPAPSPGVHAGTETVLVVEDEPALRRLAERALTAAGYAVLTAETGEEGAAVLEAHRGEVHLMLTDVVLPGMSGRELAAQVAPLYPDVRVLFTSGYTDDTVLRHGVTDQTARFLAKPYTVAELTRKVREALDADPAARRPA